MRMCTCTHTLMHRHAPAHTEAHVNSLHSPALSVVGEGRLKKPPRVAVIQAHSPRHRDTRTGTLTHRHTGIFVHTSPWVQLPETAGGIVPPQGDPNPGQDGTLLYSSSVFLFHWNQILERTHCTSIYTFSEAQRKEKSC